MPADSSPNAIARSIIEAITAIPRTKEPASESPRERARRIVVQASLQAAACSGALALPAGPASILTVLPDLMGVWRIQAQMVADLAGAFGKSGELEQEQMLYCLFRHAAAQIVRDLAARAGERIVFRRASLQAMQVLASKLGVKVTERAIAKSAAKWIPIAGAAGVAAYAYFDTTQVGATAVELFELELVRESNEPEAAAETAQR